MEKKAMVKSKASGERMPQICLALPVGMVGFIDKQAELNGRTRAGQVRFFLTKELARLSTAKKG